MRTDYIYAFSPATAIQDGIIYDFFFFFHLFLRQMLLLSTNSFLIPRSPNAPVITPHTIGNERNLDAQPQWWGLSRLM